MENVFPIQNLNDILLDKLTNIEIRVRTVLTVQVLHILLWLHKQGHYCYPSVHFFAAPLLWQFLECQPQTNFNPSILCLNSVLVYCSRKRTRSLGFLSFLFPILMNAVSESTSFWLSSCHQTSFHSSHQLTQHPHPSIMSCTRLFALRSNHTSIFLFS